ncbi:MAG: PilZ domain-containing protein [Candidatus Omnitrophica bacterium]|nr:PilZ domain-containing protein [Candidatus Omnitrophota bacterium]
MEFKEQRKIPRWQIDHQALLHLEGACATAECRIRDLSLRGARIIFGPRLTPDTFIHVKLCLDKECICAVEAWIVWRKSIFDTNSYGLFFTKISDGDKEKIFKFLLHKFPDRVYNRWRQEAPQPQGGLPMDDRRIFARFKSNFLVKVLNLTQNNESFAHTRDFSAKGVGLVTRHPVKLGSPLELWLAIPDKGEPLYTRGEVVWSKRLDQSLYHVGVSLERADLMGLARVLRIE